MARNQSSSAHNRAVEAIASARQHVRKYRFDLERSNVPEDQIFINSNSPNHPQKNAHAALMDYYEEINQVEYILLVDDIWTETFTDDANRELKVEVPKYDVVEKTVDESNVNNMIPDMSKIETQEETVSLETLGHKWAGRTITVKAKIDSPYREAEYQTETVRLWLPPMYIKRAYSQLNNCLSKIGLLAQTKAPVEHDPDPI